MVPINFENNIKEKLGQRRLQPSADSWKNLQERLDANETSKSNKTFWWLGIAASFIGVLVVANLFFGGTAKDNIKSTIVNTESESKQKSMGDKIIPIEDNIEESVAEAEKEEQLIIDKKNLVKEASQFKKQNKIVEESKKEVIADVETKHNNSLKEKNVIATSNELTIEELKIQEVVAQLQALKKVNKSVSDAEINALLDQAQKEIALHKLYDAATKKVDANALLEDVEADLEQSFRTRAFEAIKSGYHYVKTGVAERNN